MVVITFKLYEIIYAIKFFSTLSIFFYNSCYKKLFYKEED